MTVSRKDFLKKVCISGVCMCGFNSIALPAETNEESDTADETQDDSLNLIRNWIANLLSSINKELDEEGKRNVLKSCFIAHYDQLKMDEILSPFIGDLDRFLDFLEKQWGWKIDYDKTTKTLIANENRDLCVCPIVNQKNEADISAICYCSEGFSEKMFSTVAGVPATATVISSIHRGDERCIYKIVFE